MRVQGQPSSGAVDGSAANPPRIRIRTDAGRVVPYFDAPPVECGGVDGSYVLERRRVEPGSLSAHTFDEHVMMLPLGTQAVRFDSRLDGRALRGLVEPGRLRFLARGDSLATSWYGPIDALFLTLSTGLFTQALGEAAQGSRTQLASRIPPHEDQVLAHLLLALQAFVCGQRTSGRLFEQSLLTSIAHRMATAYAAGRGKEARGPSLPAWKLKRLTDYIHDRLGDELSLLDLARLADMSPYHLARAFRHGTGNTLWRYVLECRARRAQQAIAAHPQAMLSEVAAACGFDSYSQFVAIFRRFHGMLPSEYRRSLSRR